MASKKKRDGHRVVPVTVDAKNHPEVAAGGAQVVSRAVSFQVKKVFLDYEEGQNPELEPTFANHFELFAIGTDVFLDIGILKPEELIAKGMSSVEQQQFEMPFYVTHRIAMSAESFRRLHVKVTDAHKALEKLNEDATSLQEPH